MAFSAALASFDGLQSTFETKWTVLGKQYNYQELKNYVLKNKKKFLAENMAVTLAEWCKDGTKKERLEKEDIPLVQEEADGTVVYLGNALYVALCMEEYVLAEELVQHGLSLLGGKQVAVEHISVGVANQFGTPFNVETEWNVVFNCLLGGSGWKMPDSVWFALWERYVEQQDVFSQEAIVQNLQWPGAVSYGECMYWLNNLYRMKGKNRNLYDRVMTEEFFCRLLLACSKMEQPCKKREWGQLVKKLQALEVPLSSQKLSWRIAKEERNVIQPGWFVSKNSVLITFFRLWKQMAGQPVILDLAEDEYWKESLLEEDEFNNFDEVLYKAVDHVKNAELLSSKEVFGRTIAEGKEMELLTALKVGLITEKMVGRAMKYAEKEKQQWSFPLLILKAHGEWDAGEAYEN